MTAGMVSVPTIVPLKAPGHGRKWEIDTRTPIEMSTATPEATIFYTVDGAKPDPFTKFGTNKTYRYSKPIYLGKGKITLKAMAVLNDGTKESSVNTKTFQISEGKEFSEDEEDGEEDGQDQQVAFEREVVRKGYTMDESFLNSKQRNASFDPRMKRSAWQGDVREAVNSRYIKNDDNYFKERSKRQIYNNENRLENVPTEVKKHDSGVKKVLNGTDMRKLRIDDFDEGLSLSANVYNKDDVTFSKSAFPRTVPPRSSIAAKHVQEETDFLRCLYCHAVRPADQFARFCNECGGALPPIPGVRSIPPDEGKIGTCPFCHSEVPMNTPSCVVCDGKFVGRSAEASSKLIEKVVCLECGTSCPSGSKRCVVCESFLPVQKVFTQNVVNKPPLPKKDAFLQCSRCSRVNSYDARFCDWCGSKPLPSSSIIACPTCKTSNQPYAKYCLSCGQIISPPVRPDYSTLYPNQRHAMQSSMMTTNLNSEAKWHSIQSPSPRAPTKSYGTQTNGLFFPSSKAIDTHNKEDGQTSNTKRPLSAFSPGKGYWRQQLDHITQHMKIYAQNNLEFRDSVSQLKIGKLLGAVAQEELDGQELSIILSYALKNKDKHTLNATAKSVSTGIAFINAMKNSKNANDSRKSSTTSKKKTRKKVRKKSQAKENKLSVENLKLLKTLQSKGGVDPDELSELISSDVSINATDSDGLTALKLAVVNGNANCIPVLIDAGAEINLKSGPKSNTALHEAVKLGMDGITSTDKLLDAGADVDIKNDLGQTPYDLALKSGLDGLISRFTAQFGQDLLKETIG